MLKLPKGLKKKKKGKKSKKDQELFTEAELEQYRREHQKQAVPAPAESGDTEVVSEDYQQHQAQGDYSQASAYEVEQQAAPANSGEDDEWRRFNALATGVDSILKKTQGDLDRIKSNSFFQRVPPPSEKRKAEQIVQQKQQAVQEKLEAEERARKEREEEEARNDPSNAVIVLSESESGESDDGDDIFDTTYIDVVKELPLAYVPESPEEPEDDGPDPFDTSYAEKVIKGPEVSKKGKKLVSIGSAVEVLTGRVESTSQKPTSRRPRRGPKDLLLVQSFDDENLEEFLEKAEEPTATRNLLDSPADLPDAPIDLSVSLHLALQKSKQPSVEEPDVVDSSILDEFDVIKNQTTEEDDEFALLAVESKTKAVTPVNPQGFPSTYTDSASDWAAFNNSKAKPARPPPPSKPKLDIPYLVDEDELKSPEDTEDPFDTKFVEQLLPASLNEDPDFDPRAFDGEDEVEKPKVAQEELFSPDFPTEKHLVPARDLLGGSTSDLTQLPEVGIVPSEKQEVEYDPFDTSAVNSIAAPGQTELKFIEKELLESHIPPPRPPQLPALLKPSLSDPDFDPRGAESSSGIKEEKTSVYQTTAERKSSLSLNIQGSSHHKVSFAPTTDLLAVSQEGGKNQKPLTPYYTKEAVFEDTPTENIDPFDTSYVAENRPSKVELSYLERDFLSKPEPQLGFVSDDDFDPRAVTPQPRGSSDLLGVGEEHNTKVLTPAIEPTIESASSYLSDPFDTSNIESNILPGKAELKLIENELLPEVKQEPLSDILSFSQDDSLPVKALTPQISGAGSVPAEDIDPFDTSFACNLAPGQAEIKLIESELIEKY